MNPFLRILEILLLVVFPLLIFYLRSCWPEKEKNINVIILPLIWYLTYALIHEASHLLGVLTAGREISDYRLFTHFWEGSFGFAYVDVKGGLGLDSSSLLILAMPYLLDVFSVIIGYYLMTRMKIFNSFWSGLIFLLLCVRPLYDLLDNYIGVLYSHSDFVMISQINGELITYLFGIVSVGLTLAFLFIILNRYKKFPQSRV